MDSYSSLHVAFNICPKASLCILYMEVKPFCPDSHCRSSSSDNVPKESSKALYSSSLEKERIFSCKLLEAGKEWFSSFIGLFTMSSELHDDKTAIAKARLKSVFLIIEKI